MNLTASGVKAQARHLGFDLCGISPARAFPELSFLSEWIARGYAGEMDYMEKSAEVRADIRNFLPGARSVIVTGTIYNTETAAGAEEKAEGRRQKAEPDTIQVARYARGE